ncbi:MAG: rhodanese-like domain-containing protein [Actinobacteria bacterium]|nr:MAG: rhodanese-like domain-containing protein [Actinomycetota bacterium]
MARKIDRAEVQRMSSEGAPVVEVLPAKEYRLEHLAGAINIPLTKLDERAVARLFPTTSRANKTGSRMAYPAKADGRTRLGSAIWSEKTFQHAR